MKKIESIKFKYKIKRVLKKRSPLKVLLSKLRKKLTSRWKWLVTIRLNFLSKIRHNRLFHRKNKNHSFLKIIDDSHSQPIKKDSCRNNSNNSNNSNSSNQSIQNPPTPPSKRSTGSTLKAENSRGCSREFSKITPQKLPASGSQPTAVTQEPLPASSTLLLNTADLTLTSVVHIPDRITPNNDLPSREPPPTPNTHPSDCSPSQGKPDDQQHPASDPQLPDSLRQQDPQKEKGRFLQNFEALTKQSFELREKFNIGMLEYIVLKRTPHSSEDPIYISKKRKIGSRNKKTKTAFEEIDNERGQLIKEWIEKNGFDLETQNSQGKSLRQILSSYQENDLVQDLEEIIDCKRKGQPYDISFPTTCELVWVDT